MKSNQIKLLFKELKLLVTPFFARSLKSRGIVNVEITHACNLNCKSCHRVLRKSDFKFMPLEELDLIFEKLENHIKILSVNGGEPTLHPQITEILKRSIERLGRKKVIMVTNGKKLNSISDELLKKMKLILFSWYPGRNDDELEIAKKKKSAGINNINIEKKSTFNDPFILPDLSKINKTFLEFASTHCFKNEYRIVNGYVYGCCLAPSIARLYNIKGLGVPLKEFKPKMRIPCFEACKYCYVIAKYLNDRYNEVDPNFINPAMESIIKGGEEDANEELEL